MRLTLLKAKEALSSHSPTDVLEDRINRSLERILVSGKFMGGMERIALLSQYGDITLPRRYRTVEGVKIDRNGDGTYVTRPLTNGWYEFLDGKQTRSDVERLGYGMDAVRSLGDGNATMHDLPLGGTLQVTQAAPSSPDALVTVYGRDSDGMPISRTLDASATIANPFLRIERVHKEQGSLVVKLLHVADDTTVTDLAIMEPTEEETYYRRYRDDALTSVASANVLAFTKVRHLELTSDEDVLPITNITALGFEMDSLQYLAENDISVSDGYHDRAINLLNEELKDSHSVDEIPGLRFHYPGGYPNLTSHY